MTIDSSNKSFQGSAISWLNGRLAKTLAERMTARGQRRFPRIPEGESVIAIVEKAMETTTTGHEGAKIANLDRHVYYFIRKLVILKRKNLPLEHLRIVEAAMKSIEENRTIAEAVTLTQETFKQHWRPRKDEPYKAKKKRRRLDQTLIHIGESCQSTAELEVPRDLTDREIREAVVTLTTSIEMISKLIRRLTGEDQ